MRANFEHASPARRMHGRCPNAPWRRIGGYGWRRYAAFISEAPMDAPRRVFRLIQLSDDWYWRLDIMRDDGLIGPFLTRDEAEKDAKETLGIREGDRWQPGATLSRRSPHRGLPKAPRPAARATRSPQERYDAVPCPRPLSLSSSSHCCASPCWCYSASCGPRCTSESVMTTTIEPSR